MRLHIIRALSILLATIALSATIIGCKKDTFDYVETTVPVTEMPIPWSNTSEFSYTPSEDGAGNVLNWTFRANNILPMDGDLYLQRTWMAVRYDPETGRQTYLCSDPVCDHNTAECPFSHTDLNSEYQVVGDKVLYYRMNSTTHEMQVMLYSMTDRTTQVMRSQSAGRSLPHMVALEEWYYFIDLVYDEEKDSYIRSLCRQFYDSGEIEVLRVEDESIARTSLMGTDGEVLYLYENHTSTLVGLSLDGKTELCRIPFDSGFEAICKDGYMIYFDGETKEMWRKNLDGSDQQQLGISDVEYFYLTDSYIYYMKIDEVKVFYDVNNIDDLNDDERTYVYYQTVYRSDHRGQNEEVVFKNTLGDDVISLDNFVVEGNYLYTLFDYHQINGEEVETTVSRQSSTYTYCRIDCTTGEVYYIEVK